MRGAVDRVSWRSTSGEIDPALIKFVEALAIADARRAHLFESERIQSACGCFDQDSGLRFARPYRRGRQIIVNDGAETESEVGDHVLGGEHLKDRQFGDGSKRMRVQVQRGGPGPSNFEGS